MRGRNPPAMENDQKRDMYLRTTVSRFNKSRQHRILSRTRRTGSTHATAKTINKYVYNLLLNIAPKCPKVPLINLFIIPTIPLSPLPLPSLPLPLILLLPFEGRTSGVSSFASSDPLPEPEDGVLINPVACPNSNAWKSSKDNSGSATPLNRAME